ncbi:MAG: outer membrane beta-barrel protein [Bacteroidetes bacterium]|nr:outer membrane beta-barrel protein [Bacteroidota bacterium]
MLLTLRYYVSFTLLILFLFKAGPAGAQPLLLSRPVTISVSNQPFSSVLLKLSRETGIRFSYDPVQLSPQKKISVKAFNKPLGEVLNQIVGQGAFAYREVGNQLVIYKKITDKDTPVEVTNPSDQKSILPQPKKNPIPDTVIITRTDTVRINKTDTLVRTETLVQHDTIRHTDTVYMYKTQKAGRQTLPNFNKNSIQNRKFREHNGFFAGIEYQQLLGKMSFKATEQTYTGLSDSMDKASSALLKYSVGAIVGYDYKRIGVESGIHLTRLGEMFEYEYSKQLGGYYKTDTVDTYYTVTGIDTTRYYVTDSSWVNIDYKKFSYKNPNTYKYLEIPILAKLRFYQDEKLELYIKGGLIADFLVSHKAIYIKTDADQSADWLSSSLLKPMLLSWQAGLGAALNLQNGLGFLLDISYRSQGSSQYKDYPLSKKFNLFNIKTGIFVRL